MDKYPLIEFEKEEQNRLLSSSFSVLTEKVDISYKSRFDALLRPLRKVYLSQAKAQKFYAKISEPLKHFVSSTPPLRKTKANTLLMSLFQKYSSLCEFLRTQKFYQDFKKEALSIGLREDFDTYGDRLNFNVQKESFFYGAMETYLVDQLKKEVSRLRCPDVCLDLDTEYVETVFQNSISGVRNNLLKAPSLSAEYWEGIQRYFHFLHQLSVFRYQRLIETIHQDIESSDFLRALGKINEMYRDKIGNELIRLESDEKIRLGLEGLLEQELERINLQFSIFSLSDKPKQQIEEYVDFDLFMDQRTIDSILRGCVSSDCTDIRPDFAFHNTIPLHLLDPGFLNFKLLQDKNWVGNIYTLAMKRESKPILVVDAIQTSLECNFSVKTTALADAVLDKIGLYCRDVGFTELYLSKFISNRGEINYYLGEKYPIQYLEVEKLGGFNHLKELKLWDENNFRNEYIETLMPGNPNLARQVIPLRRIKF